MNKLRRNEIYLKNLAKAFGVAFPNRNSMMLAAGMVFSEIALIMIEGVEYYQFFLECPRKKGNNTDMVLIRIKQDEGNALKHVKEGTELTVLGSLRSKDWCDDDGGHHLEHYLEACHFEFSTSRLEPGMDNNIVILNGFVCTNPEIKVTNKDETIAEYRLAVENENYVNEYFPILVWNDKAVETWQKNKCGDRFKILGRLFSRVFSEKKKGEERIAYEITSFYTYHQRYDYYNNKNKNQQRQNRGSV